MIQPVFGLAVHLVALLTIGGPTRPWRPHPHPASRWPGTVLLRPRPTPIRSRKADARRADLPRGGDQRLDHGWLLRDEQEVRRGRTSWPSIPTAQEQPTSSSPGTRVAFRAEMPTAPDDVKFVSMLLDDLATVVNVDPKRVYATGMSNGGMMCYRLAAELSDRIAAIAPVSGTMAIPDYKPKRPVPVMHFHGTADTIVPFSGPSGRTPKFLTFKSVEETIRLCAEANGCPETPTVTDLPDDIEDGTTVKQKTFGPGTDGAEVVLVEIEGGGHTWPGQEPPVRFIGKSTKDISANDLMWEFFQKHPMK